MAIMYMSLVIREVNIFHPLFPIIQLVMATNSPDSFIPFTQFVDIDSKCSYRIRIMNMNVHLDINHEQSEQIANFCLAGRIKAKYLVALLVKFIGNE